MNNPRKKMKVGYIDSLHKPARKNLFKHRDATVRKSALEEQLKTMTPPTMSDIWPHE